MMNHQQLLLRMIELVLLTLFALLFTACSALEPLAYSEVLKTYPKDAKLCATEASIEPDGENLKISGEIHFQAGDSLLSSNLINVIQCYGTKVTVNGMVTIDEKTYESGTLLTVDKNLHWTIVPSWD